MVAKTWGSEPRTSSRACPNQLPPSVSSEDVGERLDGWKKDPLAARKLSSFLA